MNIMRNRKLSGLVEQNFSTRIRDDATRRELNLLRIVAIFKVLIYGTLFAIAIVLRGDLDSNSATSIALGFLCTLTIIICSTEELKCLDLFIECSKALKESTQLQKNNRPF